MYKIVPPSFLSLIHSKGFFIDAETPIKPKSMTALILI